MKKTVFKFFAVVALSITLSLYALNSLEVMASAKDERPLNYLVIGLDDAAGNADIIILISTLPGTNELSFLQIPRDTYYSYGGGQNKINGVFASYRNSGMSEREALTAFSSDIENVFGIDITASFAVTLRAFRDFVTHIGGVRIDMPYEYSFTDEHGEGGFTLNEGENMLDGDMAETFIRYRRSYLLGDLSRMNAQKIFLKGMIKTVTSLRFAKLAKAVFAIRGNLYTNCKITDVSKLLVKKPGRNDELACRFITLPGEAVISSGGGSYFSANRKNSCEVLLRYFGSTEFDVDGLLLNSGEPAFYNVYFDESASYFEYNGNNLDSIKLR